MASISLYCITAVLTQIFAVTNCEFPSETNTSHTETFPKNACESLLTNCTCDNDFEHFGSFSFKCSYLTDFSNFTALLTSGEIFKENSTYRIIFTDIQYLPSKMLDGLNVDLLTLNATDMSTMDMGVFEGVQSLRNFSVPESKLREIPDFRTINNSIQTIRIDNSQLKSLEGQGLQGLSEVRYLFFRNNSIQYIDPDVFKGTDNVLVFNVSYNFLTHLPPNLIKPWTKIVSIDLSHNQLHHVNHLFAVAQPQHIYLGFNNIFDIDSILYPNMTNVKTLDLSNNLSWKTSIEAFNGKIPNVIYLKLHHCRIRHFNANHFDRLNSLLSIGLDFNPIKDISNPIIRIGYELELKNTGTELVYFSGKLKFRMRRVRTNNTRFQNLDQVQIVEVLVTRNHLQYLSAKFMLCIRKTANLKLQGNEIMRIDRYSFATLRSDLQYLNMSNNFITSLNGSVKYLSQLKLLSISDNRLETFEQGEFTGLHELSEIYLQNNRFKTLLVEQMPTKLAYLYLAENPLQCNCRIYPFLVWLNSSSIRTDIQLCPPNNVEKDEIEINTTCPELCTCTCAADGDDVYMSVNCSSRSLTVIPYFLTDDFIQKQGAPTINVDFRGSLIFDQSTEPYFHIQDRVLDINLENNRLESLKSAQLPGNLIHLYLSNNRLQSLPEYMLSPLKKLKGVSLSGNPWDCNCQTIVFKKWLFSKWDIVQDVNTLRCWDPEKNNPGLEGKIIWTLTDSDLCLNDKEIGIWIAFGIIACILLCLASKMLYARYNMCIKVYLYTHGVTWVKEKDLDHDKQFDAFIAFCDKDQDLVDKEFISVIEQKDPNIRLCIHYKHFKASEDIEQNIYHAVQNSKKTVLVLSRDFLESEWCLFKFRTAHSQALQDKVNRIIIIKVGELPNDIDPTLKTYLESAKYLIWGKKNFWDNFLYALPTSKEYEKVNEKFKQHIKSTMEDNDKMKHNVQILNNVEFSEETNT